MMIVSSEMRNEKYSKKDIFRVSAGMLSIPGDCVLANIVFLGLIAYVLMKSSFLSKGSALVDHCYGQL